MQSLCPIYLHMNLDENKIRLLDVWNTRNQSLLMNQSWVDRDSNSTVSDSSSGIQVGPNFSSL